MNQAHNFDPCKESVEEFEARYKRKFPPTVFGQTHQSVKCTCPDGGGPTHWAAIRDTPEAIEDHRDNEECLADLRAHATNTKEIRHGR